jgi:iron complex outermembrane receptor protein
MRPGWITIEHLPAALLAACCSFAAQLESAEPIPNITITEQKLEPGSDYVDGAKIRVPARDLPLGLETLSRQLVEALGANQTADLLHLTTSAIANPSEGGVFDQIALRGFGDTPFYRNGINDSFGQLPARSLVNVERIEILKGPYGALFGPAEPGGSINLVTKRPEPAAAAEFTLGLGSYSSTDLSFDSTGPLGGRQDLQYRLIAAWDQADSFRDFVDHEGFLLAPSLAWQPSARLAFDAALEYTEDERVLDPGIAAIDNRFALPIERFLGEPDSGRADISGLTLQLSAGYALSEHWELELSLTAQGTDFHGRVVEPSELDETAGDLILLREAQDLDEETSSLIGQIEASGMYHLFGDKHHLVVGLEASAFDEEVVLFTSDSDDDPFGIDPFAPVYGQATPELELDRDSHEETRQVSIYVQDLWEIGPRWRFLIGARYDYLDLSGTDSVSDSRFDNTTGRISPRLGLVYHATSSLSWFASYSQSIEPNEGLQPNGSPLSPSVGESVETGIKWVATNKRLSFDASVFAIRQSNVTTDAPGNPGFEIQTSRQENFGVDLELKARPLPWLQLIARYNYLDSEITDDPVIPAGTAALNIPEHQFSLLTLASTSLRRQNDSHIGLALNYVDERQGSLEPEELSLVLPDYVRLDAFASFAYGNRVRFHLKLQNLTDEEYFQGSQSDALRITPGAPLTVSGQISLRF